MIELIDLPYSSYACYFHTFPCVQPIMTSPKQGHHFENGKGELLSATYTMHIKPKFVFGHNNSDRAGQSDSTVVVRQLLSTCLSAYLPPQIALK